MVMGAWDHGVSSPQFTNNGHQRVSRLHRLKRQRIDLLWWSHAMMWAAATAQEDDRRVAVARLRALDGNVHLISSGGSQWWLALDATQVAQVQNLCDREDVCVKRAISAPEALWSAVSQRDSAPQDVLQLFAHRVDSMLVVIGVHDRQWLSVYWGVEGEDWYARGGVSALSDQYRYTQLYLSPTLWNSPRPLSRPTQCVVKRWRLSPAAAHSDRASYVSQSEGLEWLLSIATWALDSNFAPQWEISKVPNHWQRWMRWMSLVALLCATGLWFHWAYLFVNVPEGMMYSEWKPTTILTGAPAKVSDRHIVAQLETLHRAAPEDVRFKEIRVTHGLTELTVYVPTLTQWGEFQNNLRKTTPRSLLELERARVVTDDNQEGRFVIHARWKPAIP